MGRALLVVVVTSILQLIQPVNAMRVMVMDQNRRHVIGTYNIIEPSTISSKQRAMITRSAVAGAVALTVTSSLVSGHIAAAAPYDAGSSADDLDCRTCQEGGDVLCKKCLIKANNKDLRGSDHTWYNPINLRVYDTKGKSFMPLTSSIIADRIKGKRVVFVAENHENPTHHKLQFSIARTLAETSGSDNLAIAMEPFLRQHQGSLDNFVFGHKNLARLLYETEFYKWGYSVNLYSRILQFAAKNNIQLVGINIPQKVVQLVSMIGISKLPDELRQLLPEVDLSNDKHRRLFLDAVSGEGGHIKPGSSTTSSDVQRMYESQSLWDEYMAQSCANFLEKDTKKKTLIVMAGIAHVKGRVSIPDRLQKRLKGSENAAQRPFVIVPESTNWDDQGLPIVDRLLSKEDCDWQVFTENIINDSSRPVRSNS